LVDTPSDSGGGAYSGIEAWCSESKEMA
jgi:hypothetical protein